MTDEVNPLISAFLKLQDANHPNIFEAAKRAKKDYDKDGKIESEKDEVWGSRFRAAKKAGKMEEATLKDPKDPSVQGSGDVTSSPMKHIRPTNPDRIKNMKDPRDSSVQNSGDVTSKGKPVSVREGIVSDLAKGAATFASDVARAYKGGYGSSAKTATGQFTRPGPVTGAAQNIARSAGQRPGAGAATGAVVGTAAALGANRPKTTTPSSTTSTSTSTPEKKVVTAPTPPSRPTYMSRGQAFSAARKEAGGAGGKFTYGGKEFHTGLKGEKVPSKLKATSVKEDTLDEAPMISPPVINQPSPAAQGQRLQSNRYYAGQSYSASGTGSGSFSKTMSASHTQVKSNVPATKSPTTPAGGGGGKEPPITTTYSRLGDREIKPPSKLGILGKAAATTATSVALGKMMADRYKEQHGSQHPTTPGVSAKDSMDRMRAMGTKSTPVTTTAPTPPERPRYMSKGQAFAAARKEAGGAGGKFSYGGKEYQTNVKGEKYSKTPKATSVREDVELDLDGFINEALEMGYDITDIINYLEENYKLDESTINLLGEYKNKEDVEFSDEELAHFESVAPFDPDETTDSSTSTKSPRRTLTDEKSCNKKKKM